MTKEKRIEQLRAAMEKIENTINSELRAMDELSKAELGVHLAASSVDLALSASTKYVHGHSDKTIEDKATMLLSFTRSFERDLNRACGSAVPGLRLSFHTDGDKVVAGNPDGADAGEWPDGSSGGGAPTFN